MLQFFGWLVGIAVALYLAFNFWAGLLILTGCFALYHLVARVFSEMVGPK